MATLFAHRTSGYALHDEKMVSSRGIGLFTSMIAVLAVVIALSYVIASGVSPSGRPDRPAVMEPAPPTSGR